jgi:hypothetical protein
MKKVVLVLVALSTTVLGVNAQTSTKQPFTFGVGVNLGLPVGNFHNTHTFGVGAQLQGEFLFSDNFTGVITSGYTEFFGKSYNYGGGVSGKFSNVGLIPILAGVRFYPVESFFIGGQIGYGIFTGSSGGGNPKGFEYLPQIGFNSESFQLILGYNGVSATGGTLGNLSLTGLYKFGGK